MFNQVSSALCTLQYTAAHAGYLRHCSDSSRVGQFVDFISFLIAFLRIVGAFHDPQKLFDYDILFFRS